MWCVLDGLKMTAVITYWECINYHFFNNAEQENVKASRILFELHITLLTLEWYIIYSVWCVMYNLLHISRHDFIYFSVSWLWWPRLPGPQLESSTKYCLERDMEKLSTLVFDLMKTVIFLPECVDANLRCWTDKKKKNRTTQWMTGWMTMVARLQLQQGAAPMGAIINHENRREQRCSGCYSGYCVWWKRGRSWSSFGMQDHIWARQFLWS